MIHVDKGQHLERWQIILALGFAIGASGLGVLLLVLGSSSDPVTLGSIALLIYMTWAGVGYTLLGQRHLDGPPDIGDEVIRMNPSSFRRSHLQKLLLLAVFCPGAAYFTYISISALLSSSTPLGTWDFLIPVAFLAALWLAVAWGTKEFLMDWSFYIGRDDLVPRSGPLRMLVRGKKIFKSDLKEIKISELAGVKVASLKLKNGAKIVLSEDEGVPRAAFDRLEAWGTDMNTSDGH